MTYEIDPLGAGLLPIREIPAMIGRTGARRPHLSVVRRWCTIGVRGVVLPTVLVGDRRYTTRDAVLWWIRATTAAPSLASPPAEHQSYGGAGMTPAQRRTLLRAGIIDAEGTR